MSDSFSRPEITDKPLAIVLAAGKGTRMFVPQSKVLLTILGDPMLRHLLNTLHTVVGDKIRIINGHCAQMLEKQFPNEHFVLQTEILGTAHAVLTALQSPDCPESNYILVINGDTPLLTPAYLKHFILQAANADLAFATLHLDDPASYGRVLRDEEGNVSAIIEALDWDKKLHGEPSGEINAGLYLIKRALADKLLPKLPKNEKKGEYYLTDLIAFAIKHGYTNIMGLACPVPESLCGINTPAELIAAEEYLKKRTIEHLLTKGVIIHNQEQVRISPLVEISPGTEIFGPCEICGLTKIASACRIDSHTFIKDCTLAEQVHIKSFSHLEDAKIGACVLIGPYARIRPQTVLEHNVHIGNFVEVKNAHLSCCSKANHLTYIGDAEIGSHCNIGAGTITCNYDGQFKHKTKIGNRTFIGSNTALVAPVNIGEDSLVAAGSVITQDVPNNKLVLARAKQSLHEKKSKL